MSKELAPLLAALNDVMKAVGYVHKGSRNDFHKYSYASEEDLLTALRPALVEYGILLIPSLDGTVELDQHGNTHLRMAYTLAHVSGAVWPEKIIMPGCGNDKNKNGIGDKGTYKALTGANKYLLFKLCQIATGDDPEVANAQEQGKASGRPPANGNGQKVAPKNTEDRKRAFLAGESYHLKMPSVDGAPNVKLWADKFCELLPLTGSGKQIDKLATDNGSTLDWMRTEHPELSERITKALQDAHKAVQAVQTMAAE